jgi:hypothetical protein
LAAWAATLAARLPVEGQPTADAPNSTAFDMATEAGLSLNEFVGLTVSSLMYSCFKPSCFPRLAALCRVDKPVPRSMAVS